MDRSHYKSHNCSEVFDPDAWVAYDGVATSGAKALNRSWSNVRGYIRHINAENLIPYLYAKSVFLNVRAHARDAAA